MGEDATITEPTITTAPTTCVIITGAMIWITTTLTC